MLRTADGCFLQRTVHFQRVCARDTNLIRFARGGIASRTLGMPQRRVRRSNDGSGLPAVRRRTGGCLRAHCLAPQRVRAARGGSAVLSGVEFPAGRAARVTHPRLGAVSPLMRPAASIGNPFCVWCAMRRS